MLQAVRQIMDEFVKIPGLLTVYGSDRADVGLTLERSPTREDLVENGAESKDVAAGVRVFTVQLLGGHIGQSANHLRVASKERGHGLFSSCYGLLVFSETEIEQLRPGFGEHDVT